MGLVLKSIRIDRIKLQIMLGSQISNGFCIGWIADIKDWNKLEDNNVQLGAKLIVGKRYIVSSENKNTPTKKENIAINDRDEVKLYYVKKGDSLFSIAKKSGVTISDLKKWNGIKNESLKAGMRLKING